jgi:hypothetical protein
MAGFLRWQRRLAFTVPDPLDLHGSVPNCNLSVGLLQGLLPVSEGGSVAASIVVL